MPDTSLVLSQFDPSTGIARIVLNRPDRLNAIGPAMAEEFRDAALAAVRRDGLRCIVLHSNGRAFAAGGDVSTFSDPATAGQVIDQILGLMHEGLLALRQAPAPVVTAVQGMAAGAGFSLALCGDLVFVAESVSFAVAYTRLGGTPDCGLTWSLSRRIGPARTLEFLLRDAVIDARTAGDLGLVTEVLPDAGFEAAVEERVARVAKGPTRAFVACRDILSDPGSFELQLGRERETFVASAGSRDFGEGVAAFRERRDPNFEGR